MLKSISALLLFLTTGIALGQVGSGVSPKYKALKCPPPASFQTWAILDRDGANRQVEKYLSSLGVGEAGTGIVASPSFRIGVNAIGFTICGHDGPGGAQKKNFIALVDAKTGAMLRHTPAPGSDPMQRKSWDVADLRDREVRIEVHDGHSGGAFAWLGIGQIEAGPAMQVDFRKGLPKDWTTKSSPAAPPRSETVRGGVPFLRFFGQYTMIPASGTQGIPCGFAAKRLFILGCTVPSGKPGEVYGTITSVSPDMDQITRQIRRAHKLP